MLSFPHPSIDDGHSSAGFEELFLETQLCLALYMATNNLTRLYNLNLAKFDLTLPQLLTLMSLWERPGQVVGDLGHALGLSSGTMSPILQRLEANGYVTRTREMADERRVHVQITKKGLDLRHTIMQLRRDMICAIDMPAEDLATTRLTLFKMIQKMSEMRAPMAASASTAPGSDKSPQKASTHPPPN